MTHLFEAVDSHTHVFAPNNYQYNLARSYTPPTASHTDLRTHLERIGGRNTVIVQPSVYGTDNRAMLHAISELGQERARGIAVIDPETATKEDIKSLIKQGVRGLRANLKTANVLSVSMAEQYIKKLNSRLQGTDSLIEVFLPVATITGLLPLFKKLGRPIILDHFAGLKCTSPTLSDDVARLQEVLVLPNIILKASGACRATDYASDTSALNSIAPQLFDAAKGRVIWGSDWPHTGKSSERIHRPVSQTEPFMPINEQKQLDDLKRWSTTHERFQDIANNTAKLLFSF